MDQSNVLKVKAIKLFLDYGSPKFAITPKNVENFIDTYFCIFILQMKNNYLFA
jgi:hypothetical protein